MNIEETLKPKLKYEKYLNNQICPACNSKEIGIDYWGIWNDERDWFYYCKNCDNTFKLWERYV